ncbi:MAG: YHYH protein [Phycisphaerales bacterium]|nr:YHYH protein [Phycisphaerales bacterium]
MKDTSIPTAARLAATLTATIALAMELAVGVQAQGQSLEPVVTDWIINTTGQTGYGGILANVQSVKYDAGFVYVKSTGVPSYTVGPWVGNPNPMTNQNWGFKLPRVATLATTATTSSMGQVGVMVNGVVFYNPTDAMSWNNLNIWHQNAFVSVGTGLDPCGGHPSPPGSYHNHPRPKCVFTETPTTHSRIVGYGFDGIAVYGPYGYNNTDGSGGIDRIASSYRKRNMTQRTTLPNGTQLSPNQYGPAVSATYPLGYFIEDFEYVAGLGDLDQFNGRFAVTPDYPAGVYSYYSTMDAAGVSEYPYFFGPQYRGIVTLGNTGMGGHITAPGSATTLCCTPCAADISGDRMVDAADLATMLSGWGAIGGGGDLNRDGQVDGSDLTELFSVWGACD